MFDWHLHCLLSGRLMMMSLWIRRAMGRSTLDQIISSEATCFYTLCWTAGLIRSHCLGCITFVCWILSRLLHQHRLRIDDDSMPETPPSGHGLWLPGGLRAESDGQEHLGSNHFIWSYMLLYSLLDCGFDPFSLSCITFVCWIVSRLLHQHRLRIDDDSMPETPPSVHGLWLPGGLPAAITPPEASCFLGHLLVHHQWLRQRRFSGGSGAHEWSWHKDGKGSVVLH